MFAVFYEQRCIWPLQYMINFGVFCIDFHIYIQLLFNQHSYLNDIYAMSWLVMKFVKLVSTTPKELIVNVQIITICRNNIRIKRADMHATR